MSNMHVKPARLGLSFSLGVTAKGCPLGCYGHRTYDASKSSTSRGPKFPFGASFVYGSGAAAGLRYVDTVGAGGYTVDLTRWCSDDD